ncbi:hypothetical protein BDV95DRAFT_569150 [Massariosphaeria phaeospora]|uniref:Uncharacterized protein n=1 Tax=Massariosphaeria phaeospora TaxID=100035 RepID=A0A7C8MN26_9PLEO|nr:hypothetical protein BDV95DRAFT_569150 [Massariosphaeria phaeospora]
MFPAHFVLTSRRHQRPTCHSPQHQRPHQIICRLLRTPYLNQLPLGALYRHISIPQTLHPGLAPLNHGRITTPFSTLHFHAQRLGVIPLPARLPQHVLFVRILVFLDPRMWLVTVLDVITICDAVENLIEGVAGGFLEGQGLVGCQRSDCGSGLSGSAVLDGTQTAALESEFRGAHS